MFAECAIQYDTKNGGDIYVFVEKQILVGDDGGGDECFCVCLTMVCLCSRARVYLGVCKCVPAFMWGMERGLKSQLMDQHIHF